MVDMVLRWMWLEGSRGKRARKLKTRKGKGKLGLEAKRAHDVFQGWGKGRRF